MESIDGVQLASLLDQLQLRNLYAATNEFLESEGVAPRRSWGQIQKAIEEKQGEEGGSDFVAKLETFIREAVLVSYKRVYLLASPAAAMNTFLREVPDGFDRSYLAADAPVLTENDFAFFLEKRSLRGATLETAVTCRQIRSSEELLPTSLRDEERQRLTGAKIVARFDRPLRCYDHYINMDNGTCLLLLDAPDKVEQGELSRHAADYQLAIGPGHTPNGSAPIFRDLFSAIKNLWEDESEGIVNGLEFVSNKLAKIRGKFSAQSNENYRTQEFQKGGQSSGAQVSPYRIAIKWTDRKGAPMVVLPGTSSMILSNSAQGAPLNYFLVPTNIRWDDFTYVLDRVISHLS